MRAWSVSPATAPAQRNSTRSWELWKGRDPRAILMLLRESDVVVCSGADLLGLNMDVPTLHAAMRPGAVMAMNDGLGKAWAAGQFGEVARRAPPIGYHDGDELTTAICGELARAGQMRSHAGELWARALDRALAEARA